MIYSILKQQFKACNSNIITIEMSLFFGMPSRQMMEKNVARPLEIGCHNFITFHFEVVTEYCLTIHSSCMGNLIPKV